jgi:predicted dehydrogenase
LPIVGGVHPTARVRSRHPSWSGEPERTIQYEDTLVPTAYGGTQIAVDFFRDMIRRLVTGEDHVVTGEDALRVLEVCEAAYRSAETGRRVSL